MLLRTLACKCLFEYLLPNLLRIYLEVELLGHMMAVFNFLKNAFMFEFLFFPEPALEESEVQKENLQELEVDVVSLGSP